MKRMNRKIKVWLVVLASVAVMIVQFACFVVVANRWQQSAGDRTFATREDFDTFVEQVKEKGALVMEEDGYYYMEDPSDPMKKGTHKEAIAYPIQNSDGYYFDYYPYRQSKCTVLLTKSQGRIKDYLSITGDVITIECIRHQKEDLIRIGFSNIRPHMISYSVYDRNDEFKGIVEFKTNRSIMGVQRQVIFFVQDASECPTFSINDITYRIENKKLVRVD